MQLIQQILFVAALAVTSWAVLKRVNLIRSTIGLGRPENRTDRPNERLGIMLRVAFGQKKMMTNWTVGIMHFVIYIGFIIINIEVMEIVLDGIFGTHRLFAPHLGAVYPFLINIFEILALGVLAVCVAFLARRYVTRVSRLQGSRHEEMSWRWPQLDATLILTLEILLMTAFLTWNASDSVLRERGVPHYDVPVGDFVISQFLKPLFSGWSDTALIAYERFSWWFHILGILAFAVYVTYSKHLHIILAFPNTYFSNLDPKGEMKNMPEVTKEVQLMLGLAQADATEAPAEVGRFGAKDVPDLSWKNLMDAYSCTECGRCTAACPANITGKKLSPRKIMMNTRDRLEDIGRNMQANGGTFQDDGKTLLNDYISVEEINACTTCQACVQECPVNINPLEIILQLRRYKIMEEAQAPGSWNAMFSNVENNQAPWKFSPSDRFNWADQVNQ